MNICIPANIRFEHYKSLEEIKLENKISAIPLEIPLFSDVNEAIKYIP
jgi:hypothetical protein